MLMPRAKVYLIEYFRQSRVQNKVKSQAHTDGHYLEDVRFLVTRIKSQDKNEQDSMETQESWHCLSFNPISELTDPTEDADDPPTACLCFLNRQT